MHIDILGTDYKFEIIQNDEELIKENADGLCQINDKKIKIRSINEYSASTGVGKNNRMEHVIIHELVHAYAEESGVSYDDDEKLVDWIAKMVPRIYKTFEDIRNGFEWLKVD